MCGDVCADNVCRFKDTYENTCRKMHLNLCAHKLTDCIDFRQMYLLWFMLFEMPAAIRMEQSGRLPWNEQTCSDVFFPLHSFSTRKVLAG